MADAGKDFFKLAVDLATESKRVGARGAAVVKRTAAAVERDGKILAPVDTGNLRNSISTTLRGDGRSNRMSAEIGPTASYGVHQEFGTSRMPPQPYMGPALDRHTAAFIAAMAQAARPRL